MREVSRREPTWRDADKTTEVVYLCRCGRKAAEVTSAAAGACRDLDPSHNAPWGDLTHLRLQRREGSQKAPSMAALLNVLRDVYSEPPEKPKPTAVRVGQVWEYSEGQVTVAEFSRGGTTAIFREQAPSGERYSIGAGTMLAHPAWRLISDAPAKPEPLPKPERVEVGQRWRWGNSPPHEVKRLERCDGGLRAIFQDEAAISSQVARGLLENDDWRYLGGNDE